jgi:hypothetical protein
MIRKSFVVEEDLVPLGLAGLSIPRAGRVASPHDSCGNALPNSEVSTH